MPSYTFAMRLALLAVLLVGCGNDLPAASFIDKLRVLSVVAEPPEIMPGETSTLSMLAVEPEVAGDAGTPQPLSAIWLACRIPSGVTAAPCGLSATQGPTITGATPPLCATDPSAALCI